MPKGSRRLTLAAPPVAFLDPARLHQPLQRAVDRSRSEAHGAVGLPQHVLEDAVAVALAVGEREQDVEDSGSERGHVSARNISVTDIY